MTEIIVYGIIVIVGIAVVLTVKSVINHNEQDFDRNTIIKNFSKEI